MKMCGEKKKKEVLGDLCRGYIYTAWLAASARRVGRSYGVQGLVFA